MSQQSDRDQLLDKVEAAASTCEKEVHGCGRCVLSALMSNFGLSEQPGAELALKGILPLSGGIAQTRNTCAALLGGVMGIGMVSIPGKLEDTGIDDIRAVMKIGNEYYRKFVDAGAYDLCSSVCGKAARMAAEFMLDIQEAKKKA